MGEDTKKRISTRFFSPLPTDVGTALSNWSKPFYQFVDFAAFQNSFYVYLRFLLFNVPFYFHCYSSLIANCILPFQDPWSVLRSIACV